jgi:hypothetical protein
VLGCSALNTELSEAADWKEAPELGTVPNILSAPAAELLDADGEAESATKQAGMAKAAR